MVDTPELSFSLGQKEEPTADSSGVELPDDPPDLILRLRGGHVHQSNPPGLRPVRHELSSRTAVIHV